MRILIGRRIASFATTRVGFRAIVEAKNRQYNNLLSTLCDSASIVQIVLLSRISDDRMVNIIKSIGIDEPRVTFLPPPEPFILNQFTRASVLDDAFVYSLVTKTFNFIRRRTRERLKSGRSWKDRIWPDSPCGLSNFYFRRDVRISQPLLPFPQGYHSSVAEVVMQDARG